MDLTTVAILKSINPIELSPNTDKRTYEQLAKLRENTQLYKLLNETRIRAPQLPININSFIGQNFNDLEIVKNEFVKLPLDAVIDNILKEAGLTPDFFIQIFLLVYFNAFVDLKYFEGFLPINIEFVLGKKNIINKTYDYNHEVCAILLPFTTSQRGLINYIKKNWKNMDMAMNNNLSQNPYIKRIHLNTEVALEICHLHEEKGMSFDQIANNDTFINKFINEFPNITDTNWIRKTYHDYKVIFSSSHQ